MRKGYTLIELLTYLVIAAIGIVLIGSLVMGGIRGCQQYTAKSWGGSTTLALPVNTKLVTITWKDTEIWYLTRPMRSDETAETYTFHEQSTVGILQGKVIITESKTLAEKK